MTYEQTQAEKQGLDPKYKDSALFKENAFQPEKPKELDTRGMTYEQAQATKNGQIKPASEPVTETPEKKGEIGEFFGNLKDKAMQRQTAKENERLAQEQADARQADQERIDAYNEKQGMSRHGYDEAGRVDGAYGSGDLYDDVESEVTSYGSELRGAKDRGKAAGDAIKGVVPRNSVYTIKDILTKPEFEGKRLSYLLDTLGGTIASLGTKQQESTALNRMNEPLEQQFAQDVADVNTRAKNAEIEPVEALLKQDTDLALRLRDTAVAPYINRYNSAKDAETKRMVLEQMYNDSDMWANLKFDQKVDLLSYLQTLGGNGSIMSLMIQKYMPDLVGSLDDILKGRRTIKQILGWEDANGNPVDSYPLETLEFDFGGEKINGQALENLWFENPEAVMKMFDNIRDENGNPDFAKRKALIDDLAERYDKSTTWKTPTEELRKALYNQKLQAEQDAVDEGETVKRDETRYNNWTANFADAKAKNYTDKGNGQKYQKRISNYNDVIAQYKNNIVQDYGKFDTNLLPTKEKQLYEDAENTLARLKDAKEAGNIFDSVVSGKILKNKNDVITSLANIKGVNLGTYQTSLGNDAATKLRETDGAYDILAYLGNANTRSQASLSAKGKSYYNDAVRNAKKLFALDDTDLAKRGIVALKM